MAESDAAFSARLAAQARSQPSNYRYGPGMTPDAYQARVRALQAGDAGAYDRATAPAIPAFHAALRALGYMPPTGGPFIGGGAAAPAAPARMSALGRLLGAFRPAASESPLLTVGGLGGAQAQNKQVAAALRRYLMPLQGRV